MIGLEGWNNSDSEDKSGPVKMRKVFKKSKICLQRNRRIPAPHGVAPHIPLPLFRLGLRSWAPAFVASPAQSIKLIIFYNNINKFNYHIDKLNYLLYLELTIIRKGTRWLLHGMN